MESDHDILIELRAEVKGMKEAIIKSNDTTRLTLLDHEDRLRFLERYAWLAIGAVGIIEAIIAIYLRNH
ncbi:MAG: hypothetical protein KGL39_14830 [Patescibacteria group bacterium]|nr:hypothetical protein [Patescibacteria group bacterium]